MGTSCTRWCKNRGGSYLEAKAYAVVLALGGPFLCPYFSWVQSALLTLTVAALGVKCNRSE